MGDLTDYQLDLLDKEAKRLEDLAEEKERELRAARTAEYVAERAWIEATNAAATARVNYNTKAKVYPWMKDK